MTMGTWCCSKHGVDTPYDRECLLCKGEESKAPGTQVGGDHYAKMAIDPFEYSMQNGLDPLQHTAIKYISRFRDKGGIQDLRKAQHTIERLIKFEEEKGR